MSSWRYYLLHWCAQHVIQFIVEETANGMKNGSVARQ